MSCTEVAWSRRDEVCHLRQGASRRYWRAVRKVAAIIPSGFVLKMISLDHGKFDIVPWWLLSKRQFSKRLEHKELFVASKVNRLIHGMTSCSLEF